METKEDGAVAEESASAPHCPTPGCMSPLVVQYDPDLECDCWVCTGWCGFIMPIIDQE